MWNRADLKSNAKVFLKANYLKAFVVSLILAIVLYGGGNSSGFKSPRHLINFHSSLVITEHGIDFNWSDMDFSKPLDNFQSGGLPFGLGLLFGLGLILVLISILVGLGIKVFIGNPIIVGGRRFYIEGVQNLEEAKLNYLSYGFNKDHYLNLVWTMFISGLINFVFYLLLFVPGVIVGYAFSMIPYILAENPNMAYGEAIALSREMTNGHKWQMLVLDLSFIGWYLLGSLAMGIGVYFVHPYADATKANLYLALKSQTTNQKS